MSEPKICNFCGKKYTKYNVTRHRKTKICQAYQKSIKIFNNMLLENQTKAISLKDLITEPYTNNEGDTIYINQMQKRFLKKLK